MAIPKHITQISGLKAALLAGMEEWQFGFMTDNSDVNAGAAQVDAPCHSTDSVAAVLVHAMSKTIDPSTGAEEYLAVEFGTVYASLEDATGDDVSYPLVLSHSSTSELGAGIGTGIQFMAEDTTPYGMTTVGNLYFQRTGNGSTLDSGFSVQTKINGEFANRIRIDYAGQVGIGSGIAAGDFDCALHVCPQAATMGAPTYTVVAIENNNTTYLSFMTPNNKSAGLVWGDPDDNDRFMMVYDHTSDVLFISVDGNTYFNISSVFDVGGTAVVKDGGCVLNVGTGYSGGAKADVSQICIINASGQNVADNDGTSSSILWKQYYYDAAAPDTFDAGKIAVGLEGDTSSTAGTQDTFFAIHTSLDGTLAEKVRITSGGELVVSVSGVLALKETTTPAAVSDYGRIYTKSDNKLYFQDGAGAEHEVAYV